MIEWAEAFVAVGVSWAVAFVIWALMKYPEPSQTTKRSKE